MSKKQTNKKNLVGKKQREMMDYSHLFWSNNVYSMSVGKPQPQFFIKRNCFSNLLHFTHRRFCGVQFSCGVADDVLWKHSECTILKQYIHRNAFSPNPNWFLCNIDCSSYYSLSSFFSLKTPSTWRSKPRINIFVFLWILYNFKNSCRTNWENMCKTL